MVGRADSNTKKKQIHRRKQDYWMARAVKRYRAEQERVLAPGEVRLGARRVCRQVEEEHDLELDKKIQKGKMQPLRLPHNTMLRHAAGGRTKSESNASRCWLTHEEIEIVIQFLLECARRGFPLNHERLKEVVDTICRARLGDAFPAEGVGKNWTARFLEKYSDRLKTHWSSEREEKRGRAVNDTTNRYWFDMMEEVFAGKHDFEFDLPLVGQAQDSGDVEDDGFSDVQDDEDDAEGAGEQEDRGVETEDEELDAAWEDRGAGQVAPPACATDVDVPGLEYEHEREEVNELSDDEEGDSEEEDGASNSSDDSETPVPEPVPILPDDVFGGDESGFMGAGNAKRRVIGQAGTKSQHQTSDGGRENTTVILTISATGKALKPVVIFKGKNFRTDWGTENPLECSLAYQEKGWTNTLIGLAYIQDFHEQTKEAAAAGRTRVLLVDGHNSHYGLEFLLFARRHRIHILCYPAHGTHVYQGLDVVVFGPLKVFWTEQKARFRRETGQNITKKNFLLVYARAHRRAVTEANIRAAFRKTGVWPFDRSVVTADMMAASLETSSRGNLPIAPSTPVRAVATLVNKLDRDLKRRRTEQSEDDHENDPFRDTMDELNQSSSSFFVSSSPIKASDPAPGFTSTLISPQKIAKKHFASLLSTPPTTLLEAQLQAALQQQIDKHEKMKAEVVALQSSMVLNAAYCDLVRGQLAAYEERKRKGKGARLVGDGNPRLLTSSDFVARVQAFHEATKAKEAAKTARKISAAEKKRMVAEWKEIEEVRKAWNEEMRLDYQEEVAAWEAEKARLKKRPSWAKPKMEGRVIPAIPKPWLVKQGSAAQEGVTKRGGGDEMDVDGNSESESEDSEDD